MDCSRAATLTPSPKMSSESAITSRRLGRLREAREEAGRALDLLARSVGPDHRNMLACQMELACIQSAEGDHQGARVNVDAETRHVVVAGRMSVEQARSAIESHGFPVASIVDRTLEDAVWKGTRPTTQYI